MISSLNVKFSIKAVMTTERDFSNDDDVGVFITQRIDRSIYAYFVQLFVHLYSSFLRKKPMYLQIAGFAGRINEAGR